MKANLEESVDVEAEPAVGEVGNMESARCGLDWRGRLRSDCAVRRGVVRGVGLRTY